MTSEEAGTIKSSGDILTRDDVSNGYLTFLGRAVESDEAILSKIAHTRFELVQDFVSSEEFRGNVAPLTEEKAHAAHVFNRNPSISLRHWLSDFLPMSESTRQRLRGVSTWYGVLAYLYDDEQLRGEFERFSTGFSFEDLASAFLRLHQKQVYDRVASDFDRDFYLEKYSLDPGIDPVGHYLEKGADKGFNPTGGFDTEFYRMRSADVQKGDLNPFYHYLTIGQKEGRAASPKDIASVSDLSMEELAIRPFFDATFYVDRHPEITDNHADPLRHFCSTGWRLGWNPNRTFSIASYLSISPDVSVEELNPFYHYVKIGRAAGRPATIDMTLFRSAEGNLLDSDAVIKEIEPYFDRAYYEMRYPDIGLHGLDGLAHYAKSGWREGRDPAPWFSSSFYISKYPGVLSVEMNPLFHYAIWGRSNGFDTFDSSSTGSRIKRVDGASVISSLDIAAAKLEKTDQVPLVRGRYNPRQLNIGWVIPDFDVGGGGHMTIFRTIKWLEVFGHKCTVLINSPTIDRNNRSRVESVLKNYQIIRAEVGIFEKDEQHDFDCLIATGWDTAYAVDQAPGTKSRFYFVQDYEPYFYPTGSRSLLAENTYSFDLDCICASKWLQHRMQKHGRRASMFELAADESYWALAAPRAPNAVPRIAFYARSHTSRRAVELGYLALELLSARGVRFVVDIFGTSDVIPDAPFDAFNHGIMSPDELRDLYQRADVGLCFSATNYSLVPQEMLVSGLAVVELDTESTRDAFPSGVVRLAEPTPAAIADALAEMLQSESKRQAQADQGRAWASSLSWEKSARAVEQALLARLTSLSLPFVDDEKASEDDIFASVIIPTFNGGELFKRVLDRVLTQTAPWKYEVIVVDSSSEDGTWEHVEQLSNVSAFRIPKAQFQHGRTRNEAAKRARGKYISFLTQDALPVGNFWLYDIVTALDRHPTAACAFGRHLAYETASPFTKRDLVRHFRHFDQAPMLLSRFSDTDRWTSDEGYRRFLHFYSDNHSCLRRSVWTRHPYPEIDYGEDQVWANDIIEAGYGKVYVRSSTVFHSHDYNERDTFERSRTEAEFFRRSFGYHDLAPTNIVDQAALMNSDDLTWGTRHGVQPSEIERKLRLNVYALAGLAAGSVPSVNVGSAF